MPSNNTVDRRVKDQITANRGSAFTPMYLASILELHPKTVQDSLKRLSSQKDSGVVFLGYGGERNSCMYAHIDYTRSRAVEVAA